MFARYAAMLANRQYAALLSSSVISEIGDWAARLALTWLMYSLTGSVLSAAVMLIASIAPAALLGPWLTVKTARTNHKSTTIAMDLARVLLFAACAAAPSPALALATGAVAGMMAVIFESHRSAWLPHVIGIDRLGTGVSLAHALADVTVIFGYAFGGILLGALGVSGALWVNAATFALSALLLTAVSSARSADLDDEDIQVRHAMAALVKDRQLFTLVGLATLGVGVATGVEAVALPVLTEAGIHLSWTGVILALAAAVSLSVTLRLPETWSHRRATVWIGTCLTVGFGTAAAALWTSSSIAVIVAVVITGLAYVALVPANVLATVIIPQHQRAQVFSLLAASLALVQSAAVLVCGAAVDNFGARGLALVCALTAATTVVVLVPLYRRTLQAERPTPH